MQARPRRSARGAGGITAVCGAATILTAPLSDGTLAIWMRYESVNRFTINEQVHAGAVAGWIAHVQTHASPEIAADLGAVVCAAGSCSEAQAWHAAQQQELADLEADRLA